MTDTTDHDQKIGAKVSASGNDGGNDPQSSSAPRGRGRKLRTPFRRRRGDAQTNTGPSASGDPSQPAAAPAERADATGPRHPASGGGQRRGPNASKTARSRGKTPNKGRGAQPRGVPALSPE